MTAPKTVVVAIDVKQPQSYLAFGPTRRLTAEIDATIDWRPFVVPPMEPRATAADDEDRGARHRRLRAAYQERDLTRYAAVQGIPLGDVYRAPDSDLAAIGLLWARRHGGAVSGDGVAGYLGEVFHGYWTEQLDIGEVGAIRSCLEEAGFDAAGFDPGPLRAELAEGRADLVARGVIGAPTYLVGDEIFHGRAHLPMIRWLLDGRRGPAPS